MTFRGAALVLILGLSVPVQAQTPEEIDALRVRAEAGDGEAQLDLGFMYGSGRGVPQDAAETVRWWRLAADQGHVSAKYNLGFMYANGEGVPQDDAFRASSGSRRPRKAHKRRRNNVHSDPGGPGSNPDHYRGDLGEGFPQFGLGYGDGALHRGHRLHAG